MTDKALKTGTQSQMKALIRKELRQILRDKALLFLLIVMPLLQLFLYGYALSPEVEHLRLGIVDYANTQTSREILASFVENGVFDLCAAPDSEKKLANLVKDGKLDAGVIIPPELERRLKAGKLTTLQVFLDGVDANTAGIASGYTSQILGNFNRKLVSGSQRSQEIINPQISFVYNPGLISVWFFAPGVLALALNLVSTMVSSAALVREKDSGTLEQLLMTPVNSMQILLAKIIPLSFLLMATVFFALMVSIFVFHLPFRGDPFLYIAVSFLAILVGISFGTSLAAFSENQRQVLLTSFFLNLPVIQLSGAIAPLESMPEFCQYLAYFNPLRYYVICVRSILLKGVGLAEIWPNVLALAFFAVVLLIFSSRHFRKQLK
jgi:ABC-2 type transport system permease protein